jgi:hypothetical protein
MPSPPRVPPPLPPPPALQKDKALIGITCIIIGALFMTCWGLVCYYGCRMLTNRPTQRPAGYVDGFAYDVYNKYGNRCAAARAGAARAAGRGCGWHALVGQQENAAAHHPMKCLLLAAAQ